MIRRFLIAATACLAVALLWSALRGDRSKPEAKLVRHIDKMCEIARDNVESPRDGVDEMFSYLGKNTPRLGKEIGALLVDIERIGDDAAHDRRAREAARRIHDASGRCEQTFQRFFAAVERDPDARAKMERGVERLSRTLQILLGSAHHIAVPGLVPARADHHH